MRAAVRTLTLAAAVAIISTGCQVQPVAQRATEPVTEPTSQVTGVRRSALAGDGYHLQTVEFADATHGFAELVTDRPVSADRNGSKLFATVDGGRSWRALTDPRKPSVSPQMYTVDVRTVVLLAEPFGWYVSTDAGASFALRPSEPAPSELDALGGGAYRLDCEAGCVLTKHGGTVTQPGLPGELGAVTEVSPRTGNPAETGAADTAAVVWTASLDSGSESGDVAGRGNTVRTAVSRDQGRTWRRIDPPAHPAGTPARVSLTSSPDGRDVWLIGYSGGGVGGVGAVAPQRRKEIGVPLLWLLAGDQWVVKGTVNAPPPSLEVFSVAAIGGGYAAVQGPRGLSVVDVTWHPVDMFPRSEWVTTLRDGTVFATAPSNRTYYLGTRTGSAIRWIQVVLEVG